MPNLNEPFFQNDDDFNPFEISKFSKELLEIYKQMVNESDEPVHVQDVVIIMCGLYTQIRETAEAEYLLSMINSALYITEQIIKKNQLKYPGRYPANREEAELKLEINNLFEDFSE